MRHVLDSITIIIALLCGMSIKNHPIICLLTAALLLFIGIFIDRIKWSKVQHGRKPIGWWYHKILCEFWYHIQGSSKKYYDHLNIMCDKYMINLYGKDTWPYESLGKTDKALCDFVEYKDEVLKAIKSGDLSEIDNKFCDFIMICGMDYINRINK